MTLLTLPIAVMANNFDGVELRVASETWEADEDGDFSATSTGTDMRVTPSNNDSADVVQFDMSAPNSDANHLWEIDFYGDTIEMKFIDPALSDPDSQYDYQADKGFHFQDINDAYPPITGVSVASVFAPKGFDPALIRFDENNIYVNLKGSSCQYSFAPRVNRCISMISPTALNNIITLNVEFDSDDEVGSPMGVNPVSYEGDTEPVKNDSEESDANLRIDALFDTLEGRYPGDLPSHQESYTVNGYRLRHYPSNNVYLGIKNDRLYFYSANAKKMTDLGGLEFWMNDNGL